MRNRYTQIVVCIAAALAAVFVLFWLVGNIRAGISNPVLAAQAAVVESPTVDSLSPSASPNDVDTPIVIHGSGFTATLSGTQVISAPTVFLGESQLAEVEWADTTTLSATVLWGMEPAVYNLTVVNPDGISSTLGNAFTVTQGLGEFITGGPYGGNSVELALNPGDPSSVYALMFGAGLFLSEDAAGSWSPIHDHDWPIHLDFDAQDPNTLYFGADSNDLYRSTDNGTSWDRISDGIYATHGCYRTYPVAHPSTPGTVYFGMGSCGTMYLEPGEGGVYYSIDYGDNWEKRVTGLSDLDVQSLAIHPTMSNTLLAGTMDGDLFYTLNSGSNWVQTTQLTGTVTRLYFNPYETLEAWATTSSDADGRGYLYRSTNLTDWTTQDLNVQPQGGSVQAQMTFLPGSVWLASQSVYSTTNSGGTWNALDGLDRSAVAIAISPDTPQEIYVGTDFGVQKSTDSGSNWQETIEGLAALVPNAVAVSPDDPDVVYVKTHQGIFASQNGGNDWHYLDYGIGGFSGRSTLAVDRFMGTRLYLGTGCESEFCIEFSPDGGTTWNVVTSTLPNAYAGWSNSSLAITPSPHTPGRVLVGASLTPPGGGDRLGIFYRSDDYGDSWTYVEPPQTIDMITEITYDAFNPNLVYAATDESGFWRSIDGGDSWGYLPVANVQFPIQVSAIAVHPNVPNKVYIRTASFADTPNPEPELWVSEDAGASWQPITYVFLGVDLEVSPPIPDQYRYSLYTGCEAGLCRSIDDGITWMPIEGVPRPENLTAATDGERSILYMGTPGGLVNSAGLQTETGLDAAAVEYGILGGGVYRLTDLLPTDFSYLPLVAR
jgi:photosystem II stability/assembly factor-like uncharacterized protein